MAKKKTNHAKLKSHELDAKMARETLVECNEVEKRIKAKREEELEAARDAFLTLFADWLAARADSERPTDDDDATNNARTDRTEELARQIVITPAPGDWAIWQKIEVLEHDPEKLQTFRTRSCVKSKRYGEPPIRSNVIPL